MPESPEPLGTRIAKHRAKLGWTQQALADRVGISRTALSHLEAGMRAAGERTVALLAGIFKLEPHELVAGTDYPTAKAERLPVVVTRHTEVELELAVLAAERRLTTDLGKVPDPRWVERWRSRLAGLLEHCHDHRERERVLSVLRSLT